MEQHTLHQMLHHKTAAKAALGQLITLKAKHIDVLTRLAHLKGELEVQEIQQHQVCFQAALRLRVLLHVH